MGNLWLHKKTGCKNTPSSSYFSSSRVQALRVWLQPNSPSLSPLVMPKGSEVHLSGLLLPLSFSLSFFSLTQLSRIRYLNRPLQALSESKSTTFMSRGGRTRQDEKTDKSKNAIALREFRGITWNQSVRRLRRRNPERLRVTSMGVCASVRAHYVMSVLRVCGTRIYIYTTNTEHIHE